VSEPLVGGAAWWYLSPRISVGPELVYLRGLRHSHRDQAPGSHYTRTVSKGPKECSMLEVTGVTKYYGALAAVRDVTFTARPGDVLGYLGPNGCRGSRPWSRW
jgi:ABC-type glutathione transport system ATPase component